VALESLLKASVHAAEQRIIGEIAERNHATIAQEATLFDAMSRMHTDGFPSFWL